MEDIMAHIFQLAVVLQEKRKNPLFLYISGIRPNEVIEVSRGIIDFKSKPENKAKEVVDIVICSGGGSAGDAFRLIKLFRSNFKEVNVIAPFWAKSAATIFCLGASRLILDSCGELGPIDAQVYSVKENAVGDDWSSALNTFASLKEIEDKALQNVAKMYQQLSSNEDVEISRGHLFDALLNFSSNFYKPLLDKINTDEIGNMSRTLDVGTMYALRVLTQYGSLGDRDSVIAFLNYITYECPEHGFVVDYDILKQYLPNAVLSSPETVGLEVWSIIQELSREFMDYVYRQSKKDYSITAFLDDIISKGEENDTIKSTQQSKDGRNTEGEQSEESTVTSDRSDRDSSQGTPAKKQNRPKQKQST